MKEQINKIIARLDERHTLQSLSPREIWDQTLEDEIETLQPSGQQSDTRFIALLSALHLRNDSIDIAHSYAQEVDHESTGAYWHGIMHRMEGDYPNAKYWFMRTGEHTVMNAIREQTAAWLKAEVDVAGIKDARFRETLQKFMENAGWEPATFVDLVAWQESSGAGDAEGTRHILEQIQHFEVMALFNYTLQAAMAI